MKKMIKWENVWDRYVKNSENTEYIKIEKWLVISDKNRIKTVTHFYLLFTSRKYQ